MIVTPCSGPKGKLRLRCSVVRFEEFGKRPHERIIADLMLREGSANRIDRSGVRKRDFMQRRVRNEARRRASPLLRNRQAHGFHPQERSLLRDCQCRQALRGKVRNNRRGSVGRRGLILRRRARINDGVDNLRRAVCKIRGACRRQSRRASQSQKSLAAIVAPATRASLVAECAQKHLLSACRRAAEFFQKRQLRCRLMLAVGIGDARELQPARVKILRRIEEKRVCRQTVAAGTAGLLIVCLK